MQCEYNIGKKESRDIPYENCIQQGDNMAPILFLFVMQAVMEMLEQTLITTKPEYCYFPNNKGFLTRQRTASNRTPFQLNNLTFVDDGAFIFQNRSGIKTGAQTIYSHFECFSLQIHI